MRGFSRFRYSFTLTMGIVLGVPLSTASTADSCPELSAHRTGSLFRLPPEGEKIDSTLNAESYASALFQRLVGVAISPRSPLILRMTDLVKKGDYVGAAKIALVDRRFYSVRMRDFATQYSNPDSSPTGEFDDLQALFIGITRDDADARDLLTADYRYEGYPDLGLSPVSLADNKHYTEFEARGLDPWKDLTRVDDQWKELDEAAGALTTRAWAKSYFSAGTNRRSIKYAMQHFLCVQMEQWRDHALPDDYVRRDVDRNNAGNPENYQNKCRGCHAGMDAMGGAFSRYDFVDGTFSQLPKGQVVAKYNQNAQVYPEGYTTLDDSWLNYSTRNQNEGLGWRGPLNGFGAASYGKMLANSKAFGQCLTKRLFAELCNRPVGMGEVTLVGKLADDFEKGGYRIRSLVTNIATDEACLAHPTTE